MAYYAGGYYAGGYYAGGFFGNLFRGVVGIGGGIIKGGVTGLLGGGPIGALKGAIVGAAGGAVAATHTNVYRETIAAGDQPGSAYTPALKAKHAEAVIRSGGAGAGGAPKPGVALIPAGAGLGMPGTFMAPSGSVAGTNYGPPMAMAGGMGRLSGYHLNKAHSMKGPRGTYLVRNRRMNWGNGRALGRAERRIAAFLHHATKYMKWAHPGKKGHAVPKLHKKRRKAA